jgi:type IV secretory pathway TrbD component
MTSQPAIAVLFFAWRDWLLSHAGVMMMVVVVMMVVDNHNHLRLRRIGYREAEKKNQSE